MRVLFVAAISIVVGDVVLMTQASAVSCVPPAATMSSADVAGYVNNPESLLDGSPDGGGKLASIVRKIATSDSSSLAAIGKAIAVANGDQAKSIGAGLGQAATMCKQKNPEIVAEIQETILASQKRDVLASYQAVVQDTVTTAVGERDPSLPDPSTLITEGNPGGGTFRPIATQGVSVADPSRSFSLGSGSVSISGSRTTTTPTATTPALTTLNATSPAVLSTSPSR